MYGYSPKSKRKRGVILSVGGWQRLQSAQAQAELKHNAGVAYTLEELNELTKLSSHTLTKIKRRQIPVDIQSLESYFLAFDLKLTNQDFTRPTIDRQSALATQSPKSTQPSDQTAPNSNPVNPERLLEFIEPTIPEGQVPLNSPYYLLRPPVEASCYQTIRQPGSLVRIKAPRRLGKSSLMAKILQYGAQQNYRTVLLSLQLAERQLFSNLDRFLRWFSASVGLGMGLSNNLEAYWDELFGSKISCKIYFEEYLLAQQSQPLLLALDDVDRLFDYPELADEFFGLLRTWHEQGKNQPVWQKLRLIVAHSTEVYIPLNVNKSPFNVGLPVELKPFTPEQIRELATRYDLQQPQEIATQLIAIADGQPYLTQLALYHLWLNSLTLNELVNTAATSNGIYSEHLRRQWWALEQNPRLAYTFSKVLQQDQPTELELYLGFKLESLGLVKLQGNKATPSCTLYRDYFREKLL